MVDSPFQKSPSTSAQLVEEIMESMRQNQRVFDKSCLDIEKSIKDLLENIEENDDDLVIERTAIRTTLREVLPAEAN